MAPGRSGGSCAGKAWIWPGVVFERLMRRKGLQGVIRGKTLHDQRQDRPMPARPGQPGISRALPQPVTGERFHLCLDLAGLCLCRLIIDVFARYIVGWRVSRTAHTAFVLDALEQVLYKRRPVHRSGLVHHSNRGSQYVAIKYTERLAEAGIEPSVGSVGDSSDNALAETINGLNKPS